MQELEPVLLRFEHETAGQRFRWATSREDRSSLSRFPLVSIPPKGGITLRVSAGDKAVQDRRH